MASVWSNTEDFAEGTPAWDTAQIMEWVPLVPWSSDPLYASGGTGYFMGGGAAFFAEQGRPYSGWFGFDPAPPRQVSPTACAVAVGAFGGIGCSAFLLRSGSWTDVAVECSFQLQSPGLVNFMNGTEARIWQGVGARLSGSTLTSGGTTGLYHLGGDGYWLLTLFDEATHHGKIMLIRVNATGSGTITRLADYPSGSTSFLNWADLLLWQPQAMKLSVVDEGGNVRVRGSILHSWRTGYVELFNYLDTSGSKITAAGRAGYLTTVEGSGGIQHCITTNWIQVTDGSGVVQRREEWQRLALNGGSLLVAGSSAMLTGYRLDSGWVGDYSSVLPSFLKLDSGSSRAKIDGLSGARTAFYTRQRPADDAWSQDRQLTFRLSSTGSAIGERGAGIALRVSHPTPASDPSSCYYVVVGRDDVGGSGFLRLYRISGGVSLLIAQKTRSLTMDADHVVRLAVDNLVDPFNGNTRLSVWVDAAQVALVSTGISGISADTSGNVFDSTSSRVLSGSGEAMYVLCPNTTARPIYLDLWTPGVGGSTTETDEGDMASIGWSSETAGATGTLETPVAYPITSSARARGVRHELDTEHAYVGLVSSYSRRRWRVEFNLTGAEYAALLSFYEDHKGSEVPFNWTEPGGSISRVVRFVSGTFEWAKTSRDNYTASAVIEEMRA